MPVTPPHGIEKRQTWTKASLTPRNWLVRVPEPCLVELDDALAQSAGEPRPRLSPEDFELPACRALMEFVRDKLAHGEGLAVVDRFPVERYTRENRPGWLLATMLGQVVAQKATARASTT